MFFIVAHKLEPLLFSAGQGHITHAKQVFLLEPRPVALLDNLSHALISSGKTYRQQQTSTRRQLVQQCRGNRVCRRPNVNRIISETVSLW